VKLIVGLGNPGFIYAHSRHNIGFAVLKALSRIYKIPLKKDKCTIALAGKGKINHQNVILATPLTYMNLSGIAVKGLVRQYAIDLDNLLVVCDDLDLGFGRLKIKPSGSSGGHRGLKSIMDSVGTEDFARLRIGIGRPNRIEASNFVLSPFTRREKGQLKSVIEDACECCHAWIATGITKTMNIFNKERKDNE
jgi:PTH1 family peptidyl-tRNA hydrolase